MKNNFKTLALTLALAFLLVACTGNAAPPVATTPATSAPTSPATAAPTPPSFDTSRNISITAREDGSGTKTAFMEIIGLKGKADPANVIIQTGTAGVLTEVRSNPGAIAYESLGYVTSDVKALKIDGVDATVANIKDGLYKISRPLSVVYKEDILDNEVNAAFFAFLESSDAQKIINDEGYVSIAEASKAYTIDGSLVGSIDISGSTSLQPLMILLADAFESMQPKVTVNVSGGGSGTGYKNAEEDVSEFGMISEEFVLDKAPSCIYHIVCKDGIAVIVNVANPLNDISMEDLKTLYNEEAGASAITKWSGLIK